MEWLTPGWIVRAFYAPLIIDCVRVVCLRPDAIPESLKSSHAVKLFKGYEERSGETIEKILADRAAAGPLLKRFQRFQKFANFAVFAASDRASAMTGAIANLTCGSLVD